MTLFWTIPLSCNNFPRDERAIGKENQYSVNFFTWAFKAAGKHRVEA